MRRALIIGLTFATALVHLTFYLEDPQGGAIYLLNALGYLALLGLLYLPHGLPPPILRLVRPALMAYATVTILLYIVVSLHIRKWTLPTGPITKGLRCC